MDLKLLSKPFPKEMIKKTKGRGRTLDYIHHKEIGKRLDEAVGPLGWKFEKLESEKFEAEILVWGRLSIKNEEGEWIEREDVGGSEVGVYKNGEVMSIVDDTKKAVTDSFKRCAARFGLARDLYGEMDRREDEEDPGDAYAQVMAAVQKGEEVIASFLPGTVEQYRHANWSEEALTDASLNELQDYLKMLRKDYKPLKKASEDKGKGSADSGVPEGFLEGIALKEAKITKLSGKAITAIRKEVIKSTDLSDDMATLTAYDKILDTLIEQA